MHFPPSKVNELPFETADSPSEQLYALHASAIFAYARLYIASREAAEDLVLDVFLAALEHPYLLARSEEIQRAWLRKVAHYKYHGSTPFSINGVDGSNVLWSPDGKYLTMIAGKAPSIGDGAVSIWRMP